MTSEANDNGSPEPEMKDQTVVVLGGSSGIGLEVARLASRRGADVIITGRNEERLDQAAKVVGARMSSAFDAHDSAALSAFLGDVDGQIDHIFVGAGSPVYARLADIDLESAGESFSQPLVLMLKLARLAAPRMRPDGTLLFMSGTGARRPALGMAMIGSAIAATAAAAANLALEIAPTRINLIAAGFVDTPLSARLLGEGLEARREELRRVLPIRRVVQPQDVALLALHLMQNTAITGTVVDIDGGQQLIAPTS